VAVTGEGALQRRAKASCRDERKRVIDSESSPATTKGSDPSNSNDEQEANRLAEQEANRKAKKAARDKLRHLKNKGVTMSTPANATANAVAHPSTLQARQADLARNFPALEGNAASSSNVDPDAQRRRDMLEYQRLEAERARATSTATESKQCAGISLYSACPAG
jgi:hypothetical protein